MDARRFDALSRSLPTDSRRGALRALGALGAVGVLDRLSGGERAAAKRKRKKQSCPEPTVCPQPTVCPEPTVCPPRDECPGRSCCVCNTSSPTPGCRFGEATGSIVFDCEAACGGPGTIVSGSVTSNPGETVVCNRTDNGCVVVGCPI